ncbi:MAG: helix-turn-helix transcriptional regulator [Pseudomonadota bacterium]|nr:helix-turn-helix transcriptional regulator [Pseudomonadota bacterium]
MRELRKAHHRTQVSMAKQLGISQDGVSRLEKRSDLLLSTLRNYVEAMGGNLRLVAEFPDQPPVMLTGFADIEDDHPAR